MDRVSSFRDCVSYPNGIFVTGSFSRDLLEAGSYLRLIDSCITQLKAQGPSMTCNTNEKEEEDLLEDVAEEKMHDGALPVHLFPVMVRG